MTRCHVVLPYGRCGGELLACVQRISFSPAEGILDRVVIWSPAPPHPVGGICPALSLPPLLVLRADLRHCLLRAREEFPLLATAAFGHAQ